MFYGEFKDGTWGSDDETRRFKTCKEIPTDEWIKFLCDAESQGKLVDHDDEGNPIMVDPPEPTATEKAESRISELKNYLASTDYVTAKIAEGAATREEYADVLTRRAEVRAEINDCEALLASVS